MICFRYVDLGSSKLVTYIDIWWRTDPAFNATATLKYIEIRIGNTLITNSTKPKMTGNALCKSFSMDGTSNEANRTAVTCDNNYGIAGRYVSIQLISTAATSLALCEVLIYRSVTVMF